MLKWSFKDNKRIEMRWHVTRMGNNLMQEVALGLDLSEAELQQVKVTEGSREGKGREDREPSWTGGCSGGQA